MQKNEQLRIILFIRRSIRNTVYYNFKSYCLDIYKININLIVHKIYHYIFTYKKCSLIIKIERDQELFYKNSVNPHRHMQKIGLI